jgi:hypothetical protein
LERILELGIGKHSRKVGEANEHRLVRAIPFEKTHPDADANGNHRKDEKSQ